MMDQMLAYRDQGMRDAMESYDPREEEPPRVGDLAEYYLADGWHFEGEIDASRDMLRAYAMAWAQGWHDQASRMYDCYVAREDADNA